jgi:alkaline phosphatase
VTFAVPDAAAAATAIATGARVNHRNVGVDPDGRRLTTILELAKAQGRSVGSSRAVCSQIQRPQAFYAHVADSRESEQVAAQFTEQARLDVALGGGAADFLPPEKGGRRRDGRDLVAELRAQGRDFLSSKAELENAATFRTNGMIGLFAPE